MAIEKAIRVESLMGPEVTVIEGVTPLDGGTGNEAIRCACVGHGSVLDGFKLTKGHTRASGDTSREQGGGGAWCEPTGLVTNCRQE